jgi:CYTH domain-containing protein
MAIEIERKFLVKGDNWRCLASGKIYRQGYIITENKITTIRVRIVGENAYLTIKGKVEGITRSEFEYPIPLEDGTMMLENLCDSPLIEKVRYRIPVKDLVWEVDEFKGQNEGLILAEVELTNEHQTIELPEWIGAEVTQDFRYYNLNLSKNPYQTW